jgi:hypothetical protein
MNLPIVLFIGGLVIVVSITVVCPCGIRQSILLVLIPDFVKFRPEQGKEKDKNALIINLCWNQRMIRHTSKHEGVFECTALRRKINQRSIKFVKYEYNYA